MSVPREVIQGYEAPIHRAVWERILTFGAPRLWSTVWVAFCLYAGLVTMMAIGLRWTVAIAVLWAVGQGVLVALTAYDVNWDDIAIAQVVRRYRAYYEAG
jgi:type IV secretory pathway TrbD component